MKKFETTIGIVVVLVMGIVVGTMVVRDFKQSIQEYMNNDLVGSNLNDDQITSEKDHEIWNRTREQNVSLGDIDAEMYESNKLVMKSGEKDTETSERTTESNDIGEKNTSFDEIVTETSENITGLNEIDTETSENITGLNGIDTSSNEIDAGYNPLDASVINVTENQAEMGETSDTDISSEVEGDASVETALNIINPSIKINAESAILLDSKTGKVLYHKNATTAVYPASTTKLMTALVAIELCDLDKEVTIGNEVNYIASDSSRAYLAEGERLTFQMLLDGMLVPSGNDAAYAVAACVGRVSLHNDKVDSKTAIKEFVRLMNEKATELGLKNTCFKNPDGYDEEGQYTTAYDMGIIAIEALKNNTIRTITGKSYARNVFLSGEDVTWYSSNKLIVSGSGKYYKYAIGLKTGSSSLAGRCLVSAAEKDGSTYISVVMNSSIAGRWDDSIALLEYGITEK